MSLIRIDAVVAQFPDLQIGELTGWIERNWVTPDLDQSETWLFADIDVARVRLIYDLRHELDVAEDTMPVMLSLLDQVYDLRRTLKAMSRAIALQPPEVRDAIAAALDAHDLAARFGDRGA
jgi:chaperone modulatory protein CbpM